MTDESSSRVCGHGGKLSRRHFCAGLLATPMLVRADDLYDDYINSTSKQPFVAFLGRKGSSDSVGHAFVGVGVQIDAGLRVYERLFGLYSLNDTTLGVIKSIFTPVSGRLDYTWKDVSWDTELRRSIDDDQKKAVLAKFDEWSSAAPQYSLLANGAKNCSALAGAVAGSVGMSVPAGAGSTRPWKYIEALKAAN